MARYVGIFLDASRELNDWVGKPRDAADLIKLLCCWKRLTCGSDKGSVGGYTDAAVGRDDLSVAITGLKADCDFAAAATAGVGCAAGFLVCGRNGMV